MQETRCIISNHITDKVGQSRLGAYFKYLFSTFLSLLLMSSLPSQANVTVLEKSMKLQPAQATSNQCTAVGTIWWNELLTPSTKELSDFYSKVVGWKRKQVHVTDQKSPAESQKDQYTIFMNGDKEVAGIMNHDHADAINPKSVGWFIYIQVADLGTAVEQAENEGGTILQEPIKIADDNRIAVIRDPLGNVFGIVQPAKC